MFNDTYTIEQVQEIVKTCTKHMLIRLLSFLLGVAVTVFIAMVYVK